VSYEHRKMYATSFTVYSFSLKLIIFEISSVGEYPTPKNPKLCSRLHQKVGHELAHSLRSGTCYRNYHAFRETSSKNICRNRGAFAE